MIVLKNTPPKLELFDNIVEGCHYFNRDTIVNNGYGCDYPDNEESQVVKADTGDYVKESALEMALLRKKYGSMAKIMENLKEVRSYLTEAKNDNAALAKVGCKKQGACFTWCCPLASTASIADMKEHDPELYEQKKIEYAFEIERGGGEDEFFPSEWNSADWMIQYQETVFVEEVSNGN